MNIDLKNERSYGATKWITDPIRELYEKFDGFDAQFSIDLVPVLYYMTDEEIRNLPGPCGYRGCSGNFDGVHVKPNYSEKAMVLSIKINKEFDNETMVKIKQILDQFVVTPTNNSHSALHSYIITSVREYNTSEVHYGIYKKPMFDQILAVMPEFTEKSLMEYKTNECDGICCDKTCEFQFANTDFVQTIQYDEDNQDNCLWDYYKNEVTSTETGKYKLTLSLIATDILPNMEVLDKLINELQ